MLSQLTINQFALVTHLDIDFAPGMTVITGETGAGKSILFDALGLALGQRADSGVVRSGSKKADITACFDVSGNRKALSWLTENDLIDEHQCLLRRVISSDGRSKAYINGHPVSLTQLKSLAPLLASIHSQHGHQQLLNHDFQRQLVDAFGELTPSVSELGELSHKFKQLTKKLAELTNESTEGAAQRQLLEYQIAELEELNLQPDEFEVLEKQHAQLEHANELLNAGEQVRSQLSDDQGVRDLVNSALSTIDRLPTNTQALSSARDLLNSALINIEEAVNELRSHNDEVEHNPELLIQLQTRIELIYDVARKHRVQPSELCRLHSSLCEQLEQLNNVDESLEEIQAELELIQSDYLKRVGPLNEQRTQAANQLCDAVNDQLISLGLENAKLSILWQELDDETLPPYGTLLPSFLAQTNPGMPAGPLAKVASGGELSRIALAISVVTAEIGTIPTLLFDEVDVGVGGVTASKVGQLMRQLGCKAQVLSVTHQPQVAAQSHHHWQVSKHVTNGQTQSTLCELDEASRTEELARMLGGAEIHQQSRDNARALLDEVIH